MKWGRYLESGLHNRSVYSFGKSENNEVGETLYVRIGSVEAA